MDYLSDRRRSRKLGDCPILFHVIVDELIGIILTIVIGRQEQLKKLFSGALFLQQSLPIDAILPTVGMPWLCRLVFLLVGLANVHFGYSASYCSQKIYGQPIYTDCADALWRLPKDRNVRYFVEQDLRIAEPQMNWVRFTDPRHPGNTQTVMQMPKWWSQGEYYQICS